MAAGVMKALAAALAALKAAGSAGGGEKLCCLSALKIEAGSRRWRRVEMAAAALSKAAAENGRKTVAAPVCRLPARHQNRRKAKAWRRKWRLLGGLGGGEENKRHRRK